MILENSDAVFICSISFCVLRNSSDAALFLIVQYTKPFILKRVGFFFFTCFIGKMNKLDKLVSDPCGSWKPGMCNSPIILM